VALNRFADRVAVVTGGANGIGRAAACRLVREGAAVAVVDRDGPGAAAAAALRVDGGRAIALEVDVTEVVQIETIAPAVPRQLGRIAVLVAAAGVRRTVPLMDVRAGEWDRLLDVNLRGLFFCVQQLARPLIEQRSGRIEAGLDAGAALRRQEGRGDQRHALGRARLRAVQRIVNAVCPGFVDTPMSRRTERESVELGLKAEGQWRGELIAAIPLGRATTPDEVAGLVASLASDEAAYITGQPINIDGGRVMDCCPNRRSSSRATSHSPPATTRPKARRSIGRGTSTSSTGSRARSCAAPRTGR
jgi:NAD(P)-dependent dehydrogenase (short-subunit alcohol dehydrogenase family)